MSGDGEGGDGGGGGGGGERAACFNIQDMGDTRNVLQHTGYPLNIIFILVYR